jgi:4-hydroxybenzoate polyprenyltransferase
MSDFIDSMTSAVPGTATSRPICVDLDGTLIRTDLLFESLLLLVKQRPLALFALPWVMLRGRAALKRFIASRVGIDPLTLPSNSRFLEWLKQEKANGRRLILVTASDAVLAERVAASCGLFDQVIASDGVRNLKGSTKVAVLQDRFPEGFDYAGDSRADRAVWEQAQGAIGVNLPGWIESELRNSSKLLASFPVNRPNLVISWMKALRVHQWTKNLLVFVPLLTSHQISMTVVSGPVLLFAALSLSASALYIANDLLDLEADRKHPRKHRRPFAKADLPLVAGIAAIPIILAASFGIALVSGTRTFVLVIIYSIASAAYSFCFKRQAPLDLFVLTGLYVFRIAAGGVTAHIPLTNWLLAFSMFFFLSLVCCKRVSELILHRQSRMRELPGRGYGEMDMEQMNVFGVSSAFVSCVILSLYLDSAQVRVLYRQPAYLWALVPLFLYWQTRVWTFTWRGRMNDDPVIFAIKDKFSYVIGVLIALTMLIAKFDLLPPLFRSW